MGGKQKKEKWGSDRPDPNSLGVLGGDGCTGMDTTHGGEPASRGPGRSSRCSSMNAARPASEIPSEGTPSPSVVTGRTRPQPNPSELGSDRLEMVRTVGSWLDTVTSSSTDLEASLFGEQFGEPGEDDRSLIVDKPPS